MQIQEIGSQLEQLVENLQRCGVRHIPRIGVDQLEAELVTGLQVAASPPLPQAPTAASTAADEPPPASATAASPTEPAPKPPRSQPKPPAVPNSDEPAQPASWTLPVLPVKEREQRLDTLLQQVVQCRHCTNIVGFRQQTVFGAGPPNPRICFVGEAPGADEDRQGVPFVGRAGQLLTKIIGAMNLDRNDIYILNALKCRPPQNRTPVPDEISACRPFIETQLDILQPEFIVCLGAVAARSLLQQSGSIGSLRGKFLSYRSARVVVTYHPSYLLRNENAKRLVWDDMKMLMAEL